VPLPIEQNQTTAVSVNPIGIAGNANTLTISWEYKENQQPRADATKLFPSAAQWNSGDLDAEQFPAVLRLTFISFPAGATSADSFKQHVYFLNPVVESAADVDKPVINPTVPQSEESVVKNAGCANGECVAQFTIQEGFLSSNNLYAAAHGIYSQPEASISIASPTGEAYSFEGFAAIDVTGRAGNVFRRVKQTVTYTGSSRSTPSYITTPFGSDALIAGEGICKLFTVGTSPSQYTNFCE
jgi:hypothetical protein